MPSELSSALPPARVALLAHSLARSSRYFELTHPPILQATSKTCQFLLPYMLAFLLDVYLLAKSADLAIWARVPPTTPQMARPPDGCSLGPSVRVFCLDTGSFPSGGLLPIFFEINLSTPPSSCSIRSPCQPQCSAMHRGALQLSRLTRGSNTRS